MQSQTTVSSSNAVSGSPDSGGLRVHVGDLLRQVGAQRAHQTAARVSGLATGDVGVPSDESVDLDLRLESAAAGIVVLGTLSTRWTGACSRCLEPVEGPLELEVYELFETEPVESETYLLEDDEIDLEPVVRDHVVLAIPPAPLCDDGCLGLCPHCGADRNRVECTCGEDRDDPRWAALDQLRFPDS